jgi:DNA-binding phage protein
MTSPSGATHAAESILSQILDACERARTIQHLRVRDIAHRARLSRRATTYTRKMQTNPTLRTLLAYVNAHGLELDIRIRTKRSTPLEDAQVSTAPMMLTSMHGQQQSDSTASAVENS